MGKNVADRKPEAAAAHRPGGGHRRLLVGLILVAFLALGLRLWVCGELAETPAVVHPLDVTDMDTYRRLASEILQGNWPEVFDYQPLYYTVLLPIALLLSPDSPWGAMILQALLGTAACLLAGLAAARLYGRRAGILAALFLALARYHIFYTPFLLLEVLFSFWTALALYAVILLLEKPTWQRGALTGLAVAGALLTRGNALLWLPGILVLLCVRCRKDPRRALMPLAALLVAFLLPILPYAIHNSHATGHLCGASVAGGKVLSLGNSPEAPAGGLEYPRTYHEWGRQEAEEGISVPRQILSWAVEEPLAFLELKFRALLLFWDHMEIPNNVSLEIDGQKSALLKCPLLLPWSFLASLALAELLRTLWPRRRAQWGVLWMAVAFWGATSAFYLLARFRVAALPILAVLAAGFAFRIWVLVRRLSVVTPAMKRGLVRMGFLFLVAFYLVNFAHDTYASYAMPGVFRALRPNGLSLEFPTEKVLYDHGPLGFGGSILYEEPLGAPLRLEKTFRPPEAWQSAEAVSVSILLRALPSSLQETRTPLPPRTIRWNGEEFSAQARWVHERDAWWLRLDFPAQISRECVLSLEMPARARLFLDTQRQYGNTRLQDQEFPYAEAVAEMVLATPERQEP